ncbi:hypothetical protein C5C17_03090 [Pseudoclavibacter sp. RFBA6]|nr:hypothetical protein C5C17_03090 [Pseudoclavibacter sp. RFBA6]
MRWRRRSKVRLDGDHEGDLRLDGVATLQLLRRRPEETVAQHVRPHLIQRTWLRQRALVRVSCIRTRLRARARRPILEVARRQLGTGQLPGRIAGLGLGLERVRSVTGVRSVIRARSVTGVRSAIRVGTLFGCPSLGVADDARLPRRAVEHKPELRVGVDDRELAEPVFELRKRDPPCAAGPLEALIQRLLRQLLGSALSKRLDAARSRRPCLLEHHSAELLPAALEFNRIGMRDAQAGVDDHERVRPADRSGLQRALNRLEDLGDRIRPTELDLHRPLRPSGHGPDLARKRPNLERRARRASELIAAEAHLERLSVELGLLAVQPVELPLVVGERGDQQGAAWAGRSVFGVLAGPVDDGGFDAESCREAVAHLTDPDGTGGHPLQRSLVACPVDDGEFDAEASLEAVTDLTRRRGTTERRCLRCLGVDGFVLHACIVSRTTDILRFGRHFLAIGATFSAGMGDRRVGPSPDEPDSQGYRSEGADSGPPRAHRARVS